jgi:4'-phosphopantetheinyl transferase
MPVRADLNECEGMLPEREVHVWLAELAMPPNQLDSLYGFLDRKEQGRASRFRVRTPREEFVASHAFLRLALSRYLQIDPHEVRFQLAESGKPELADGSQLRFNLSHTDGTAVVAVTRNRAVGVDVERIRQDVEAMELAERFFSAAEVHWLRSQPAAGRIASFLACWTAKEAYIKACGTGLSTPLAGFSVIPCAGNEKLQLETFDAPASSRAWSIWQLDLGASLRSALAVQDGDAELMVRLGKWRWPQTLV